jgi:hypothetical protein
MKNKKIRTKMPRSQRAKQFMPFKAVSGLDEALRQKEAEAEQRQNSTNEEYREQP